MATEWPTTNLSKAASGTFYWSVTIQHVNKLTILFESQSLDPYDLCMPRGRG